MVLINIFPGTVYEETLNTLMSQYIYILALADNTGTETAVAYLGQQEIEMVKCG